MKHTEKTSVIIFGTNNYTEIFEDYLEKEDSYEVCAYTVDKSYVHEPYYHGKPLIPFEEISEFYPPESYKILLAVGYNHMNDGRKQKYNECKEKGYEVLTYIHPTAKVFTECIGEGSLLMAGCVVEHGCSLGICNIVNPNALISHNTEIGNFNFIAGSCSIAGNVIVKDNCMLGMNSTVKNGVLLEAYTLLGAGAYINHDTCKYDVYVPARSVKLENKKSFEIVI